MLNNIICEYIWIGGYYELRSKTRLIKVPLNVGVLDAGFIPELSSIPEWNYDASSTGQLSSDGNTKKILKPVACFIDPLRHIHNRICILVLCDTYNVNGSPLKTNHRCKASEIFKQNQEEEPWFGLEQEYFIVLNNEELFKPYNSLSHYCGTVDNRIERLIAEQHLDVCLNANLNISGINAEVSEGQWEFQIGPSIGIDAGDHLIVARYLLERIAEKNNARICYHPKPSIDVNGSGCHTNFSTKTMREENGVEELMNCMKKLETNHKVHLEVYGLDNEKRLTGYNETASYTKFSWGIGTRNTSVRIPNQVLKDKCGYFEDRRPASNMDPYQVTLLVFSTCCLQT